MKSEIKNFNCGRCENKGISHFKHVMGGKCFKCGRFPSAKETLVSDSFNVKSKEERKAKKELMIDRLVFDILEGAFNDWFSTAEDTRETCDIINGKISKSEKMNFKFNLVEENRPTQWARHSKRFDLIAEDMLLIKPDGRTVRR